MVRKSGTKGPDNLRGTRDADEIFGLGGNDIILGLGGDDDLFGNGGDDTIRGGAGNDEIQGGSGNDQLRGGAGDDQLFGGNGQDRLFGGNGNDTLDGGKGNDFLNGGSGNDILEGGKGDDTMLGGTGDDELNWDDGDGSDLMSGGEGSDTVNVTGSITRGDDFELGKNDFNQAFFERKGFVGEQPGVGRFTLTIDTVETIIVNGDVGNDVLTVSDLVGTGVTTVKFFGGAGDDKLDGTNTTTALEADGGEGNDTLIGSNQKDTLQGGAGNDTIAGEKGDDIMIGGAGNDTLEWDDGDGSDRISGNEGRDTVVVEGSVTKGDDFVLGKNAQNLAIFERKGFVGETPGVGAFTLTVDTAEVFDVSGEEGNDVFKVNDLSNTGVELVIFSGGAGNDSFDGSGTNTPLQLNGDAGVDTLVGGAGNDVITGGDGLDILTGGGGSDRFVYSGNPFANGTPNLNGATGINVLNTPDTIQDFLINGATADQFGLKGSDLGINEIIFRKGASNSEDLSGGNVLVLTEGFANAAAAADAIKKNTSITADQGVFVYFNTALGISRLVFSQDLGDGGNISVLANLGQPQPGNVVSNQNLFSQNNFSLV